MTAETRKFNAETDKIFNLMVHSLYEKKEIFIRELISNSSDALDKLRYEALKDEKLQNSEDFKITFEIDKEKRILIISDNGIGMNKDDLINNLGTIAGSGTQKFLDQLTGDQKKDSQLIGQFGVGFYSCFMVADSVSVVSQKAGEDQAYLWISSGNGEYQIEESPEKLGNGTRITLHIKEGEDEFLDAHRIKNIAGSYSNHIAFKIIYKEKDAEDEVINEGKAIWLKNKSEISEEEYKEFYKSISFMGDDEPWMTLHNHAEGVVEYSNLLFIPSKKPFDLFHPDRMTRVKLYIKRVLISEKLEIIPQYLRFLRGVVDSADLQLNISRETVQNDAKVKKISDAVSKKTLRELAKKLEKDRENYLSFWNNFGAVVKEGLCDGGEPRDEILATCLFQTNKDENCISLKEYKERMPEDQKSIYFITANDREAALASPQIEGFIKKGYEVIILTDHVDDFWVNVVFEYDGVPFKSVTKAGKDLEGEENKSEDSEEDKKDDKQQENKVSQKLIEKIKEVLGNHVMDVRTTARLSESPVCITVDESGMDIRLERFMLENKQLAAPMPKIFEINPDHSIIKTLEKQAEEDKADNKFSDTVKLLFAQANIIEGEPVPDIKGFSNVLNRLIEQDLAA
jgi:molecular chaperone HtpG